MSKVTEVPEEYRNVKYDTPNSTKDLGKAIIVFSIMIMGFGILMTILNREYITIYNIGCVNYFFIVSILTLALGLLMIKTSNSVISKRD